MNQPPYHRYFLLLFVLYLIPQFSRSEYPDSLIRAIKVYPNQDTTRVNLLAAASLKFQYVNMDSMLLMARQGYTLAERLNYRNGMAECLKQQGIGMYNLTQNDSALKLYQRALEIALEEKNERMQGALYNNIGIVYSEMGELKKTIVYYEKSLGIRKRIGDVSGVGSSYNNLGNAYLIIGNYSKALTYLLKGLKIREKLGDSSGVANSNSNTGNAYYRIKKYDKAYEHYFKALEINERIGNPYGIMLSCIDLGALQYEVKDYKTSQKFFERSLSLATQIGAVQNEAISYCNLGELSRIDKKYTRSINYYKKSLEIALAAGDFPLASSCYSGIGYGMVQQGKTKEGIALLKKAFNMASQYDDINNTVGVATYLHEALAKTGDYINAYRYLQIAKALTDSIERENDVLEIQQIGFDYELSKKEERINHLMKEREYEQQRANLNRYLVYALSLMGLFAFGFIFTLYRSREKSRKHSEITHKQNDEIKLQAQRLQELNELNNHMFSIISHDLRNPIATLSNILQLEKEHILSPEDSRNMKETLSTQVNSIGLLLDNLLLWARTQVEKNTPLNPTVIEPDNIIETNIRLLSETARQKNVSFEHVKNNKARINADAMHTDIVIRNLLANAIKFSNPLGKITVTTTRSENFTTITVKDQGIGMDIETLQKINSESVSSVSNKGTSGETGSGLGLKLCKQYIKLNGGSFTINSELGKGTECIVSLPIV